MTPYGAPYEPARGLGERARRLVLRGFRIFGSVTAPLRSDPDYLIIGTKRGGTTSLARWLHEHPDVRPMWPARETRKGAYFFDVNYGRGHRWYRSHFPVSIIHRFRFRKRSTVPLLGDATPYYLHHPLAPKRARRHAPDAKVIALLRNPVDRAYGHWAERTRNGVETEPFPEALRLETERLAGEEERLLDESLEASFAHQHHSYVDQGRYARGLRRWLTEYPAEQVLVIRSEDLYTDPATIYRQVLDFLGIGPHEPAEFAAWNLKPKDPIADSDREFLVSSLRDDVAELESLLGRSMHWDDFE